MANAVATAGAFARRTRYQRSLGFGSAGWKSRLMKSESARSSGITVRWTMFSGCAWLAQQGTDADAAFFWEPGKYRDPDNGWKLKRRPTPISTRPASRLGSWALHPHLAGLWGSEFTTPAIAGKVTRCFDLYTAKDLPHTQEASGVLRVTGIDRKAHPADTVIAITTE